MLELGTLFPISGSLAADGAPLRAATQLAVDDINTAGGIPGINNISLLSVNEADEGEPGSGASCAALSSLLAPTSGVDAIIGPAASADLLQTFDRVAHAGTIMVSPEATSPAITDIPDDGYIFRTIPSDVLQGRVLADTVIAENNTPDLDVAVVARGDSYGRGLQSEVINEITGFNVRSARPLEYTPGRVNEVDFTPVVTSLQAQRPGAIVLIGFDEVAPLIKQLAGVGINPRTTKIYGSDGFLRDTLTTLVAAGQPADLAGLHGTKPLLPEDFKPRLRQVAPGIGDFTYGPQAYDATIITALAAAAAGTDDPTQIKRSIPAVTRAGTKCTTYRECITILRGNRAADIDYDGPSGPLDFTGAGEPCQAQYSLVTPDNQGLLIEYRRAFGTNLCTGVLPGHN